MKKIINSHFVRLVPDVTTKKNGSANSTVRYISKVFFLTLTAMFSLVAFAIAQPSNKVGDLSTKFRESRKDARLQKQEIRELKNIPQGTFDQFKMDFPKAQNAEWSSNGDFSTVDYTLNNKECSAYYGSNHQLIGTSNDVAYQMLPKKGRDRIAKDYPGYTPIKTMFFDDNEANNENMQFLGSPVVKDSYFTLLKNGDKQVVVQTDRSGEVTYISNFTNH